MHRFLTSKIFFPGGNNLFPHPIPINLSLLPLHFKFLHKEQLISPLATINSVRAMMLLPAVTGNWAE